MAEEYRCWCGRFAIHGRHIVSGWTRVEERWFCRDHVPPEPVGAGTVALVADRLGRDAIGIELNAGYVEMSRLRVSRGLTDSAVDAPRGGGAQPDPGPLFAAEAAE